MDEGLVLFCILVVIAVLIGVFIKLLRSDYSDDAPTKSPPPGYYPTLGSTSASSGEKKSSAPAKRDNEQSYYQFSGPGLRQCAYCGCENDAATASCQVCGQPL